MIDKNYKQCLLTVKDIDGKKGIVQFYAASFGVKGSEKDSDGDVIVKGAFTKTLREQAGRIKHFKNHNSSQVPGVIKEAVEDAMGLLITSQFAKDSSGNYSTLAKDTMIEYEAGVITEHSHGFKVIKESFDEKENCNFITESKLWEVSSLTAWGANKDTPMVGLKSLFDLEATLKAIDKTIRSTNISDEGALSLLKMSEQITEYLKSLKASQPVITTEKGGEPIDFNFLSKNFNL